MKIKNYPIEERPREKACQYGVETLSNAELLALVLRTGTRQESVVELAQRIINEIGGFNYFQDIAYHQLVSIKGIKQAKAIELLAVIEIAKRLKKENRVSGIIKEPLDGYNLVKDRLLFEQQEKVILFCLNARLEVIKEKTVFVGSNNVSIICGRELFKEALLCGSSRIMIIHNHPSGNPEPSLQDIETTNRLYKMAEELEIEVVDHLIIGNQKFYSFALKEIVMI